jgi:hypothetical protein
MSEDAKFPTILPAALADFADTLDAVGELDESEKPARHIAIQAVIGFFQSAGIDKEVLHRLWKQQEGIEQLKQNLRRRDAMEDPLQATLFTLAHIRRTFESLGIESARLDKLERALSDVLHGHPHPLFQPRRQNTKRGHKKPPDTHRRKYVPVRASALMQLHKDAGKKDDAAAEEVAKVLDDEGFKLTKDGGTATAGTVVGWRKKIRRLPAKHWEREHYNALTPPTPPTSAIDGLLGIVVSPEARNLVRAEALIPLVEQWLREAVAEAQ